MAEKSSATQTEVAEASVETRVVAGEGAEGFKPVKVYNVKGDERTASSQSELYALEFDGFHVDKPTHRSERRAKAKKR